MNNVYTISYVIVKLYSETVKNTWGKHIKFKSKNSILYKLDQDSEKKDSVTLSNTFLTI